MAAVDLATALRAVELIEVDYEPLPVLLTVEQATAEGAPLAAPGVPGQRLRPGGAGVRRGVEAALAQCDLIQEGSFFFQAPGRGLYRAQPVRGPGGYRRGCSTCTPPPRCPHYVQRTVAMVTGLSMSKVRVVKPYVGGGFGPKASATPIDLAASFFGPQDRPPGAHGLHSRAGVPLLPGPPRLHPPHEDRGHERRNPGGPGPPSHPGRRGLLLPLASPRCITPGRCWAGPTSCPTCATRGPGCSPTSPPAGPQRGHGGVIARALFEQQLDIIADKLGMDPIELRLKNMMETGDVTCNDLAMSSLGMRECLEAVKDGSGWEAKKGKLPPGKGIGVACGFFRLGRGLPHLPQRDLSLHHLDQGRRGRRGASWSTPPRPRSARARKPPWP